MINFNVNSSAWKIFAGLAVIIGGVLYCRHYWQEAPGLSLYLAAARCLLEGASLQQCDATFTYPPLFALVMVPLVPLPLLAANVLWYAVTIGSLFGCFTLSAFLAQRLVPADWSERDLAWLYGIGLVLSLKFVLAAIGNQSYDAPVVALALAGLAGLATKRPLCAGASLGLAAALKATPLLFLPYLVYKRRYKSAVAMVVVVAVASILPDLLFSAGRPAGDGGYLLAWIHQVAGPALTEKLSGNPSTFWVATNPNNNSLRGLLGLFFDDNTARFKFILYPVDAVFSAIIALLIMRANNTGPTLAIDGSLLLISMLMLSPMTSQSHYVALILPLFAVAAVWLKGDAAMRKNAAFFLVANAVLPNLTSTDLVGRAVTFWAKERRLLVIDCLLLVIFFAILAARLARSSASAKIYDGGGAGSPALRQSSSKVGTDSC